MHNAVFEGVGVHLVVVEKIGVDCWNVRTTKFGGRLSS